jgi:hypothetical protein
MYMDECTGCPTWCCTHMMPLRLMRIYVSLDTASACSSGRGKQQVPYAVKSIRLVISSRAHYRQRRTEHTKLHQGRCITNLHAQHERPQRVGEHRGVTAAERHEGVRRSARRVGDRQLATDVRSGRGGLYLGMWISLMPMLPPVDSCDTIMDARWVYVLLWV